MWGIWDKNNEKFCRHHDTHYDSRAIEAAFQLAEMLEEEYFNNEEIENLEKIAHGKNALHLFCYESNLDAFLHLRDMYPLTYSNYEIVELPADEPEWIDLEE